MMEATGKWRGALGEWRVAGLAVCGMLLLAAPVSAEWYLAADLLQARFAGPSVDGTWKQEQLPSRDGIPAVKLTRESLAWDVGAGYRFDDGERWYSNLWSIEGGYRHWGSGVTAGGLAISDEHYGQLMRRDIDPRTVKSSEYEATDHLQGGYLRAAKAFAMGYGVEPYLSAGFFVAYHDLNFWTRSPNGHMQYGGCTGLVAGPTLGGGVKYALYRGVKARIGVESHWSMTESGHPISSQWLTVGGGIEVPLDLPLSVLNTGGGSWREYLWQRF